jgi:hypothetical protein
VILAVAGWYAYRYYDEGRRREIARTASHRTKAEERQSLQGRKDSKPKKPRSDLNNRDQETSDKAAQIKQRPIKSTIAQVSPGDYSTDDAVDNREFARSMAGLKQGTSFTGPKKSEEKKQRSVKQSKAQEIANKVTDDKLSAPSSTTGADADDDQSPTASPDFHAVDSGDISDMLEKPAPGPSVLRITNTEEAKRKEKKAKEPEQAPTRKQKQNKKRAEEAKAMREEAEKERLVKMEVQRRTARIAEGRAAKDGSEFFASKTPATSAWTANNANGGSSNGEAPSMPVQPLQPLDTFEPVNSTNGVKATQDPPSQAAKTDNWKSAIPSEEEQMKMVQEDQEWNTVSSKKPGKGKKRETSDSTEESDGNLVTKPQQVVPVTAAPVVTHSQQKPAKVNGRPTIGQQSSFAALASKDNGPEEEEEWDV